MNATKMKTKSAEVSKALEDEETLYLRGSDSGNITINIDHLEVDRICSQCGHWKSEHPWETCTSPNWL